MANALAPYFFTIGRYVERGLGESCSKEKWKEGGEVCQLSYYDASEFGQVS